MRAGGASDGRAWAAHTGHQVTPGAAFPLGLGLAGLLTISRRGTTIGPARLLRRPSEFPRPILCRLGPVGYTERRGRHLASLRRAQRSQTRNVGSFGPIAAGLSALLLSQPSLPGCAPGLGVSRLGAFRCHLGRQASAQGPALTFRRGGGQCPGCRPPFSGELLTIEPFGHLVTEGLFSIPTRPTPRGDGGSGALGFFASSAGIISRTSPSTSHTSGRREPLSVHRNSTSRLPVTHSTGGAAMRLVPTNGEERVWSVRSGRPPHSRGRPLQPRGPATPPGDGHDERRGDLT
jgi:hypothetical protein